eukprot:m.341032 g.341032  ORF g.341032 m.341032 type:complete len:787 (+) comp19763_c0_seq1:137-2497(+)
MRVIALVAAFVCTLPRNIVAGPASIKANDEGIQLNVKGEFQDACVNNEVTGKNVCVVSGIEDARTKIEEEAKERIKQDDIIMEVIKKLRPTQATGKFSDIIDGTVLPVGAVMPHDMMELSFLSKGSGLCPSLSLKATVAIYQDSSKTSVRVMYMGAQVDIFDWEGPMFVYQNNGGRIHIAIDINSWANNAEDCFGDIEYTLSVTSALNDIGDAETTIDAYTEAHNVDVGAAPSEQRVDEKLASVRAFVDMTEEKQPCTEAMAGTAALFLDSDSKIRHPVVCNGVEYVEVSTPQPGETKYTPAKTCNTAMMVSGEVRPGMYWIGESGGDVAMRMCGTDEDGKIIDWGGNGQTAGDAGYSCETVANFFNHKEGNVYVWHNGKAILTYCDKNGEMSGDGLSEERSATSCDDIKKIYKTTGTSVRYVDGRQQMCNFAKSPAEAIPDGRTMETAGASCAAIATTYADASKFTTPMASGEYFVTPGPRKDFCHVELCSSLLKSVVRTQPQVVAACNKKPANTLVAFSVNQGSDPRNPVDSCDMLLYLMPNVNWIPNVHVTGATTATTCARSSHNIKPFVDINAAKILSQDTTFLSESPNANQRIRWTMYNGLSRGTHDNIPVFNFRIWNSDVLQRSGGYNYCIKTRTTTQIYWFKPWGTGRWRTLFRNNNDHLALLHASTHKLGYYANRGGAFRDSGFTYPSNQWTFLAVVTSASSNSHSVGKVSFYMGTEKVAPRKVGRDVDRNGYNSCFYRFGWPGQSPGYVNRAMHFEAALTLAQITEEYEVTNPFNHL